MSPRYWYSDAFGYSEEDEADLDEEGFSFREHHESRCVSKACTGCGRTVQLPPDYALCDRCCRILEAGGDLG